MSIQYPKTEHVTLPSVEQWGTNANILRDPPKSITTRRIDKVFQNTDITDLVDDSGDRINDGINVYARGVNPMVSISYDNVSNNAGISGNPTSTSNRVQARLPYPVMEGGAFRPPIYTQRDLLPLSRLPRTWFSTMTTPGFADFSKTIQRPNDYRAIKDMLNIYDIKPNKTTNIEKPLIENFKMMNTINDKHINVGADSGIKSNYVSSYTRENADIYKGINEDNLNVFAQSNIGQDTFSNNLEGLTIDQNRYIQNHLSHQAYSNASQHSAQGLSNINMNTDKYLQDNITVKDAFSNISKSSIQNLSNINMGTDKYLQDNITVKDAFSNISKNSAQNLSNINMDISKYLQDATVIQTFSNMSSDISAKNLEELYDNGRISVKNNMIQYTKDSGISPGYTFLNEIAQPVLEMRNPQFEVQSQISDSRVHKRIDHQNDLHFDRNTPLTSFKTNITKLEDFNSINLSNRNYHRLDESLNKGSFNNVGIKPTINRADMINSRESDKDKLRNRVNNNQFNRYNY